MNQNNQTDATASRFAALEIPGSAPAVNEAAYSAAPSGMPDPKGKAKRHASGKTTNALGLESTPEHLHISRVWQDKCKPMQSMIDAVNAAAPLKSDVLVSAGDLKFDTKCRLSGMELTNRGFQRVSRPTGVPKPMIDYLVANNDSKALIPHLNREFKTIAAADPEKKFLLRTIKEDAEAAPKLRAIFSETYAPINNSDALEMLCKALPGGNAAGVLASHFSDSEDLMSGNFFLPDRMKTMPDSDYGVGIAFRNSEVGKSSLQILPFLFRAICLNGLIWGRLNQEITVRQIHAGKIDFAELQKQINLAVETALAHGTNLLTVLQATKEVQVEDPRKMIATLASRFDVNREQARAWDVAFNVEPENTAFGILNGLTRAAQGFESSVRGQLETIAGEMLAPSLETDLRTIISRWERFEADAHEVKDEQVVRLFAAR